MGRAGPQPIIQKIDGPGRGAVHDMWALYGPFRPAHEAAHVFSWAGPGRGPWYVVYCCYYYYDVRPAHEAAQVFSWAGPGRGP